MIPIEKTSDGMLVFLKCGCAGLRGMTHPSGAAALVVIKLACGEHVESDEEIEGVRVRSIPRGELVSPFVRQLLTADSLNVR